jgi:hypothetical protein
LQVVDQMGERWLVEIVQHVSQFLVARSPGSESGPIGLPQRGYERIAVLLADFAVLVSMTGVEAGLLCHDGFHGFMNERNPLFSRSVPDEKGMPRQSNSVRRVRKADCSACSGSI